MLKKIDKKVIRRNSNSVAELIINIKKALVQHLKDKGVIHSNPSRLEEFSTTLKVSDMNVKAMKYFAELNKSEKVSYKSVKDIISILSKLGLLQNKKLKNTASFAFGKNPQGNEMSESKVRCALVNGLDKRGRMISNSKLFEGNVFELIEQASEFVSDKIEKGIIKTDVLRHKKESAIPLSTYREAIINAILHRDYFANGNVEIVIYDDRIVITNPALKDALPSDEDIKENSVVSTPLNKSLADILFRTGYIEKFGSGIVNMIKECKAEGIKKPIFKSTNNAVMVTLWKKEYPASTPQVRKLLSVIKGEMSRDEIQKKLKLKDRENFRLTYIKPAVEGGLIEATRPNETNSSQQKYRITQKGEEFIKELS